MPRISLILLLAITALACASAGNQPARRESCGLTSHDSVFVGLKPVYRDCAVDRRARFISTDARPNFRAETRSPVCYFADLEFVVDSLGKPEVATARIVRSNYEKFGEAVLETLSAWKYEPAVLSGKTVRQIVASHQVASMVAVLVPKGSPPPSGPPPGRAPTC